MSTSGRWYFGGRTLMNGFWHYQWVQKIVEVVGTRHNLVGENYYYHPVETFWPVGYGDFDALYRELRAECTHAPR